MCAPSQEKTTFFDDKCLNYYQVISFRLKNVRATYHLLVKKTLNAHFFLKTKTLGLVR